MADTEKIDKLIVTNLSALQGKYGSSGAQAIQAALQQLIAADQNQGLLTRLYFLDDAGSMTQVSATQVTNPTDPKQNKDAMDTLYKALAPDYILIVGSVDVVPHQDLTNPMYSQDDDPDTFAFGDLPYACEAPYSQNPQDFLGPTRVVSRLPDITGAKDTQYLIELLDNTRSYGSRDPVSYRDYFGISAEVWRKSTESSVTNVFGRAAELKTVPPENEDWPPPSLGSLAHFINCHGAPNDSHYYGQPASGAEDYPCALDAAYINGRIAEGTVVAAECCYGAQLYDPSMSGGQYGICNTYLANKAYGFFGSTTIAYGPADGNDSADLICQYFMESVLSGASLGRAALEARQKFIHTASISEQDNIKTVAQYNLYADPSLTPIKSALGIATAAKDIMGRTTGESRVMRAQRRRDLFSRGIALANSQPLTSKFVGKLATEILNSLQSKAEEHGMTAGTILTYSVKASKASELMPKGLTAPELFPERVHVIFRTRKTAMEAAKESSVSASGTLGKSVVSPTVALIVKESQGNILSVKKVFAK